jgi:hypothetical protein
MSLIQCLGPTLDVGYVTAHVSVAWPTARSSTGCVLLTKRVKVLTKTERGFIRTQFSDLYAALDACYSLREREY